MKESLHKENKIVNYRLMISNMYFISKKFKPKSMKEAINDDFLVNDMQEELV